MTLALECPFRTWAFGWLRVVWHADPSVSLWFFKAPGIVLAWSRLEWWRLYLVRLGPWVFEATP